MLAAGGEKDAPAELPFSALVLVDITPRVDLEGVAKVQGFMREMVDAGCTACVMEVSSHALSLRRVLRIDPASAIGGGS
mgnify:CR=1 FL=1